jgi:hypothetical protein
MQAVSRKAEGIEPRKSLEGKDNTVQKVEVNTSIDVNGKEMLASPGSETMACMTLGLYGNLGDPEPASEMGVCLTTEEGGRQIRFRESDSLILPMKAGNAAGEKEATHGRGV